MAKDHSLRRAQQIRTLSDFTNKDRVGSRDLADMYTFSVNKSSSFELGLSQLSDNVDVELYEKKDGVPNKTFRKIARADFSELFRNPFRKGLALQKEYRKDFRKSLNRLAISKKGGKKNEQIITELGEGEYYIRVRPSKKSSKQRRIKYTLDLSGAELVADVPSIEPTGTETPVPSPTPSTPTPTPTSSTPTPTPAPNPGTVTPTPTPGTVTPTPTPGTVTPTPTPGTVTPSPTPTVVPDGNETVNSALGLSLPDVFRTLTTSDLNGLPSGAEPFSISNTDTEDYYQFVLSSRSDVTLQIGGLTADIDLRLLDSNQVEQAKSTTSAAIESIEKTLDAGTYYLRVQQGLSGEESDYILQGSALSRDDNDTPETADNLGELTFQSTEFSNSNTSLTGDPFSINATDTIDYFKVSLPWESELRFTLKGLQGDLKMSVVDADGTALDTPIPDEAIVDTGSEITIAPYYNSLSDTTYNPTLVAGDYLIKIEPEGDGAVSENYSLDLAAIPIQEETFETGDTLAEAREFPITVEELNSTTSFSTARTFGDTADTSLWVGGKDPVDYYKLVLDEKSYFSLELFDRTDGAINTDRDNDLNVSLLKETGTNPEITTEVLVNSARAGNLSEIVGGQLEAGTYYIQVEPATEADGAFYQMDLALFGIDGIPALTEDVKKGSGNGVDTGSGNVASFGEAGVVFIADSGGLNGEALWTSTGPNTDDDTEATKLFAFDQILDADGTVLSDVANDYSVFDSISELKSVDNQIYFLGQLTAESLPRLWTQVDNGGDGNFQAIAPENAFFFNNDELPSVAVDSTLYFITYSISDNVGSATYTGAIGTELWSYDGTRATDQLQLHSDIGSDLLSIGDMEVIDETGGPAIYFTDDDGNLYRHEVDGNTAASQVVDDGLNNNVTELIAVGTDLYLVENSKLKRIDDGDTENVTNVTAVSGDYSLSATSEFVTVDSDLYFTGSAGSNLWHVDSGSPNAATKITSGLGNASSIKELTVVDSLAGSTLYFSANTAAEGTELWSMSVNGANTNTDAALAADINVGTASSSPQNLIAVGDTLYFSADNGSVGAELWKYEAGQATLVYDIQGNVILTNENGDPVDNEGNLIGEGESPVVTNSGSAPADFVNIGERLFFTAIGTTEAASAIDGRESLGRELWVLGLKDESLPD